MRILLLYNILYFFTIIILHHHTSTATQFHENIKKLILYIKQLAFTRKIKTTLSYFDSTIIFWWYSLQAQLYKLLFCADTLVTTFSLCSPNKMLSCDLANSPNIWCCFLTQEHTSQLTQLHIIKSTISRLLCVLVVWQLLTFVVFKNKDEGTKMLYTQ